MGFDHFALIHHVDFTNYALREVVAISNYPPDWVVHYRQKKMAGRDPVLLAAQRSLLGFRWSDVPNLINYTRNHSEIREETLRAGIGDGFTVPANVPGEFNGSCNFAVHSHNSVPDSNLHMAQMAGSFAFQAARNLVARNSGISALTESPRLTDRQLECVVLVGRGKTDWEISTILGVSEDTVKYHVDQARRKMQVVKRSQLVARTLFEGQISLIDLL